VFIAAVIIMTFGLFLLFKYRVRAPPPDALQVARLHIL
jgi:hypothetical protein